MTNEQILGEIFGKYVCRLMFCTNLLDVDVPISYVFSKVMVAHIDVLRPWTHLGKSSHFKCTRVVFKCFAMYYVGCLTPGNACFSFLLWAPWLGSRPLRIVITICIQLRWWIMRLATVFSSANWLDIQRRIWSILNGILLCLDHAGHTPYSSYPQSLHHSRPQNPLRAPVWTEGLCAEYPLDTEPDGWLHRHVPSWDCANTWQSYV